MEKEVGTARVNKAEERRRGEWWRVSSRGKGSNVGGAEGAARASVVIGTVGTAKYCRRQSTTSTNPI